MSREDSRRTFYRLVDQNLEEPHFFPCSSSHEDCYLKPPEFYIPPPPAPPWVLQNENDCGLEARDSNSNYIHQTCDNTILMDSTSRLHHDDTLQNVLVIVVCSILLVVIVLAVAVVIWRRRTRFLRSLMRDEMKPGNEDHPKIPPSNDIELHENPDALNHVFTNPNYPQQTINIGGLPFYLLPASKDSNVDECGGSYVSSSVLTVGPIYEDIVERSETLYFNNKSPPLPSSEPPLPSSSRGRLTMSNSVPPRPESRGPSSHCTSSSEVSIDSNSSPVVLVNPSGQPHTPSSRPFASPRAARSGGVYYYSDTLRNNHKHGRNPNECESDSGISNSRTSTEEGTPPSRHVLRINSGRKAVFPPLPPSRRPVDTEVSMKSYKGSVQV